MTDKANLQLVAKSAERIIKKETCEADEPKTEGNMQKEKTNRLPKTQQELNVIIKERIARDRKQMRAKLYPDFVPGSNHTAQIVIVDYVQNDDLDKARKELIVTKAELQAIKLNFRSCVIEDAVCLSLGYLQKSCQDINDGTILNALKRVLRKYPKWAENGKDKDGRMGAPK